MLIFYIDEFGDPSMSTEPNVDPPELKKGVSEWFLLSAVGVRDSSRQPLAEAMFALKKKHFGEGIDLQPWGESEIKGRFLYRVARSAASKKVFNHPKAYAALDSVAKVNALLNDLELIFASFRPLVFCVAVDKVPLLGRPAQYAMPPLGAAYAYLQQRVSLTLEKLHAGECAILVADQQTQHEIYFRTGEMNRIRDLMTKKLPVQPNFNLVLDKPLWVDTEFSSWDREIIQLADIVAYSVAECLKRGEAPKERCYMWDRIRPLMAVQWSTGGIESGGLSIYPKPAKYPKT